MTTLPNSGELPPKSPYSSEEEAKVECTRPRDRGIDANPELTDAGTWQVVSEDGCVADEEELVDGVRRPLRRAATSLAIMRNHLLRGRATLPPTEEKIG